MGAHLKWMGTLAKQLRTRTICCWHLAKQKIKVIAHSVAVRFSRSASTYTDSSLPQRRCFSMAIASHGGGLRFGTSPTTSITSTNDPLFRSLLTRRALLSLLLTVRRTVLFSRAGSCCSWKLLLLNLRRVDDRSWFFSCRDDKSSPTLRLGGPNNSAGGTSLAGFRSPWFCESARCRRE